MRLEKVATGLQPLQSESYNKQTASIANREQETNTQHTVDTRGEAVIKKEDMDKAITKLNEFIEPLHTNLKFKYHEKLKDYYVTIVDSNTNEVIKEIPSKKMLDMYANMVEFMGLFVDEKG